jgi:O-antigen/teichoic acid export membrane protein
LYGPRYAATAASLLIATAVGLVNLLNGQITTIFFSRGLPQLHRRCVALMAATMILTIYPLAKWIGPVGGQVAALLSVCTGYICQLVRVHQITDLSRGEYGKSVALPALTSILVLAVWAGTQRFQLVPSPIASIALGLGGCALAYGVAGALFFRLNRI